MPDPRGPQWGTPSQQVSSDTDREVGGAIDAIYATQAAKSKRIKEPTVYVVAPTRQALEEEYGAEGVPRTEKQEANWQRVKAFLLAP